MRDIFYEEVAVNSNYNREKNIYDVLTTCAFISIFVAFSWVVVCLMYLITLLGGNAFIKIIIMLFPLVLFVFIAWFLLKLRNKYCIEYDYTVLDDSVRIDKVIRNQKRFKVADFSTRDIEKVGKFGSDTYNNYADNDALNIEYCTPNELPYEGKEFYYVVIKSFNGTTLFVVECIEQFISTILKTCRKGTLEADYK